MARLLSRTLIRQTAAAANTTITATPTPISPFLNQRRFSKLSGLVSFIELLEESSADFEYGSDSFEDTTTTYKKKKLNKDGLAKLSELLHGITVLQSRPDWLPFIPGASYWVPPANTHGDSGDLLGLNCPELANMEGSSMDSTEDDIDDLSYEFEPEEEK